ncbi:FtsK/SpoIIIE family protein [Leuconostoc citreum LBAE C10]|uniref:hypothetical protein n=1 Tax=Leuconostoc citreum TaxID=33964 RepID=UPI0002465E53|nr:hypothetical protein [Leuconostoc citreum]CCF24183.1 FtsK/SpoIIIE family protein [Leuconostoc citreum LBAE C10]
MGNSFDQIELQLIQSLNMALRINNETSYNHAFDVRAEEDGFLFIPLIPCSYAVDDALYQNIFSISSALLYPEFTLLKQNAAFFVPLENEDFHTRRALKFPWSKGVARRLEIENIDDFAAEKVGQRLPIMENYSIDLGKINHIGIAGQSGSGKTTFLVYLLYMLMGQADIKICDPKLDEPSRFARKYGIPVIASVDVRNKNDYVSSVNQALSSHVDLIYERQRQLYSDPDAEFEHSFIVIDELLALTENVTKGVRESFQGLVSTIALLGRATRVHLILVSQRFDSNALSTSTREQLNMIVQIGNINSRTTNFLMPDLDPSGIVIPQGIGAGLIQVIDSEHPYQVMPLLTPTFKSKEM